MRYSKKLYAKNRRLGETFWEKSLNSLYLNCVDLQVLCELSRKQKRISRVARNHRRCGEVSRGRRWCIALQQPTAGRDCTCTEVSARYRPRMSLLFVKKVQIWPGGVNMPARTWAAPRPAVPRIAQPEHRAPSACLHSALENTSITSSSYRIVTLYS